MSWAPRSPPWIGPLPSNTANWVGWTVGIPDPTNGSWHSCHPGADWCCCWVVDPSYITWKTFQTTKVSWWLNQSIFGKYAQVKLGIMKLQGFGGWKIQENSWKCRHPSFFWLLLKKRPDWFKEEKNRGSLLMNMLKPFLLAMLNGWKMWEGW